MQITGKITCIDEFGIELATDEKTVIIRDLPLEKVREAASYFMADVTITIELAEQVQPDQTSSDEMNTAKSLLTMRGEAISREAQNRAARVGRFPNFVRYTFPDDSMLVIGKNGSATAYEPNEEGDETP